MTDNDKKLIHDLEVCSEANHFLVGGERYKGQALSGLFREALDLINRQEAKLEAVKSINYLQLGELESKKAEIKALINGQETLQKYIAEQKAQIERLRKKGEWIRDEDSYFYHRYNCSVCGYRLIGEPTNFCDTCGAKMKEGVGE